MVFFTRCCFLLLRFRESFRCPDCTPIVPWASSGLGLEVNAERRMCLMCSLALTCTHCPRIWFEYELDTSNRELCVFRGNLVAFSCQVCISVGVWRREIRVLLAKSVCSSGQTGPVVACIPCEAWARVRTSLLKLVLTDLHRNRLMRPTPKASYFGWCRTGRH